MPLEYSITYSAENQYENNVLEAFWQFLILPENNENQRLLNYGFTNSLGLPYFESINGLGHKTFRINCGQLLRNIQFKFQCQLIKEPINPFEGLTDQDPKVELDFLTTNTFRIDNEPFLRSTRYTVLPKDLKLPPVYDQNKGIFDNMLTLNQWVYEKIYFKTGVTNVNTTLQEVIEKRQGVCQDFTHLFCAIARSYGVPARYVSGYIGQGKDYFGDLQMHAWAEALVPKLGWVGFDPTNNILAAENHIKVACGKDYSDVAPLKGVVYTTGNNITNYTVKVHSQQIQQ